MKKYTLLLIGLLMGAIIFGAVPAFAETTSTISAIFDRVKLVVNGKMTDTSTLLYDGRTYVQLRDAADAFGASLDWDGATNTATLTTGGQATAQPTATPATATPTQTPAPTATVVPAPIKAAHDGTRQNPYKLNDTVTCSEIYGTIQVTFLKVIRGQAAWEKVQSANRFNKEPADNQEYYLAEVNIKAIKQDEESQQIYVSYGDFGVYNSSGVQYELKSATGIDPKSISLFEGANGTIWVSQLIDKNDNVSIIYDDLSKGSIWFNLN